MPEHTIAPIYDKNSEILILGSFPSVKSRMAGFYYGHPQNRFWRVTSAVFGCDTPKTDDDKRKMLVNNGVALWDVVASCEIIGSSDASITGVIPNDLSPILETAHIKRIFTNGSTAERLYKKYQYKITGIESQLLPSTSPANAGYSLEKLISAWREKIEKIK